MARSTGRSVPAVGYIILIIGGDRLRAAPSRFLHVWLAIPSPSRLRLRLPPICSPLCTTARAEAKKPSGLLSMVTVYIPHVSPQAHARTLTSSLLIDPSGVSSHHVFSEPWPLITSVPETFFPAK